MVKHNECHRCIYEYDAEHTIGGKEFLETDPPNFKGSFYSDTKGMVENVSFGVFIVARDYVSTLISLTYGVRYKFSFRYK